MNVPRKAAVELILQLERWKQLLIQLKENNYIKVERPWLFCLEKYGSSPLAKSPARSYWLILIVLQNLQKSASTSRTGSQAHDGVINLRETPSTSSSLVLLLGLISRFPTNELRVATNAQKRHRINYDSFTMSKNVLGIWYESRTIFRNEEFVAKVLNSSKLLSRIPDRPTNCKNWLRTVRIS